MARSPGDARAGSGSDPGRAKVLALLRTQGKIAAIKELRDQQPALGLKGAKEEVERMEAALPPSERRKEAGCLGLVLLCSGAVLVMGGVVAVAVGLW